MDWHKEVERNREAIVASLNRIDLPTFIDGEDILHDVYEVVLRLQLYTKYTIEPGFVVDKAHLVAIDAIRKERGQSTQETVYREDPYKMSDTFEEYLDFCFGREREVLYWVFVEGYTHKEIAKMLECSEGTVFNIKWRALNRIKEGMEWLEMEYERAD